MECEKFLVEVGLYHKLEFTFSDYNSLYELLNGDVKINSYCKQCKADRIYIASNKQKLKLPPRLQKGIITIIDNDPQIYASIKAQEEREKRDWMEKFISNNRITNLTYKCSKDDKHIINFIILMQDNYIMKIGQYPSYRDLDLPQAKTYEKILGNQYYREFTRAIGLYSNEVGIGSFVYLRRIIEKLVIDASELAIKEGKITEDEFIYSDNGKHKNTVEEKIKIIKDYLPKVMTENAKMYGIVSKGIHQLSEQECLEYFPVLESILKLTLNDMAAKKERLDEEKRLKKAIGNINP